VSRRAAAALLGGAAAGPAGAADVKWEAGGLIQTDIRYRPQTISVGSWYSPLSVPAGFSRNQNLLKARVAARSGSARAVLDADLVLMGFPDTIDSTFALSRREIIDPFRAEVHSAYMEAWDVGVDGLDLRVGQQKVQWGVADQFNPTNNLNADDLEDPLLFGDQLGNVMVRADYTPTPGWTLSAVVVPVFKPALLPGTGDIALGLTDRVPVSEAALRRKLFAENALAADALGYPTVVSGVAPLLPENTLENMQWSARIGGAIGMHDVALSWYQGRFDFPVAYNNHTTQLEDPRCNPADPDDCINGLLQTTAGVRFPKMQVLGFNGSGEVNPLGWMSEKIRPIGYRLELAWIRPEAVTISVTNDELLGGLQPAGEYDYGLPGGRRPTVVTDDPFLKWTLGLDYSFGRHLYVNAQWVHGMPDEFGAGDWLVGRTYVARGAEILTDPATGDPRCTLLERQGETCVRETLRPRVGDYGVVGMDVTFGSNLLRFFTILDFTPILVGTADPGTGERVDTQYRWHTPEALSMVLYPELSHNFNNGFELAGGAVVMIGEPWTKFGDPATGGTQIFTRARYSF
jgi:hypothetical protein